MRRTALAERENRQNRDLNAWPEMDATLDRAQPHPPPAGRDTGKHIDAACSDAPALRVAAPNRSLLPRTTGTIDLPPWRSLVSAVDF